MMVEFPAAQYIIGHMIWDALQHMAYRQKTKNTDYVKQVLKSGTRLAKNGQSTLLLTSGLGDCYWSFSLSQGG